MMRVFGGWDQYQDAPEDKVQEQIAVWIGELRAKSYLAKNPPKGNS